MGQPKKALKVLKEYIDWRMGLGWERGTVVQIKVGDTLVITRITDISLPDVWVVWGYGCTRRHVSSVLPLLDEELKLTTWEGAGKTI